MAGRIRRQESQAAGEEALTSRLNVNDGVLIESVSKALRLLSLFGRASGMEPAGHEARAWAFGLERVDTWAALRPARTCTVYISGLETDLLASLAGLRAWPRCSLIEHAKGPGGLGPPAAGLLPALRHWAPHNGRPRLRRRRYAYFISRTAPSTCAPSQYLLLTKTLCH
jgi:hypothetical protein